MTMASCYSFTKESLRLPWQALLRLGHDLQAQYFALAGDGDCGETLTLADGRVVKRLPEPHSRPYPSMFGDFAVPRVVYGTREGQRIEAAPLDARLGLPEDQCSYLLRDWNQALVVENPYGQVNAVLGRILGLKQSVASLETMTRTLAGAVAGHEATRPPVAARSRTRRRETTTAPAGSRCCGYGSPDPVPRTAGSL